MRQRVSGGMNRSSDQQPRIAAAHATDVRPVAAQVDAVGAGGLGHVGPIVDDHAGRRAGGAADDAGDEALERPAVEIALADLNDVDASGDGRVDLRAALAPWFSGPAAEAGDDGRS